jgi:hypothetical protein
MDPNLGAMIAHELAQAVLIVQPHAIVERDQSLKQREPRRALGRRACLAVEEIRVAGMQQPPLLGPHRDATMTPGVAL